jgi:hypothetical protein
MDYLCICGYSVESPELVVELEFQAAEYMGRLHPWYKTHESLVYN